MMLLLLVLELNFYTVPSPPLNPSESKAKGGTNQKLLKPQNTNNNLVNMGLYWPSCRCFNRYDATLFSFNTEL